MHLRAIYLLPLLSLFLLLAPSFGFVANLAEVCHELAELSLVAGSVSEELMGQELVSTPSLFRVLDQALVYEVLELA